MQNMESNQVSKWEKQISVKAIRPCLTPKEQSKFNGYLDLETNKKNDMLINMCSRKLSLYKYSSSAIYTTLWAQDCKSNTDKIDYTGITKRQKVDNIFWGGKQNQQKIKILIKKNKKNYKIKKIK